MPAPGRRREAHSRERAEGLFLGAHSGVASFIRSLTSVSGSSSVRPHCDVVRVQGPDAREPLRIEHFCHGALSPVLQALAEPGVNAASRQGWASPPLSAGSPRSQRRVLGRPQLLCRLLCLPWVDCPAARPRGSGVSPSPAAATRQSSALLRGCCWARLSCAPLTATQTSFVTSRPQADVSANEGH